jgi:hypothetical protein
MLRRLVLVGILVGSIAGCGDGEAGSPSTEPGGDTAAPSLVPPTAGGGEEADNVIELQSSGSLGFVVVGGPSGDGWCAHLVGDDVGKAGWDESSCTVDTSELDSDGVSFATEAAPLDAQVQVLYGLAPAEATTAVVEFEQGATSSTTDMAIVPRTEMDGIGSFSVFLRPDGGTATGLVLLDAAGTELTRVPL